MPVDEIPAGPADDDWLIVPKWDKFQHYKSAARANRRPAWIKVYTELLYDPNYLGLSLASKGLLHVIWLAYATSGERLTVVGLRSVCHDRFGYAQLISLNQAGFLEWRASDALEPKEEVEVETPISPYTDREAQNTLLGEALNAAADWEGGTMEQFDKQLVAFERRYQARLSNSQREALWTEVLKRDRPLPVAELLKRFTNHA